MQKAAKRAGSGHALGEVGTSRWLRTLSCSFLKKWAFCWHIPPHAQWCFLQARVGGPKVIRPLGQLVLRCLDAAHWSCLQVQRKFAQGLLPLGGSPRCWEPLAVLCFGHALPLAAQSPSHWRHLRAASPMCGNAPLAATALMLVWCLVTLAHCLALEADVSC